MLTIKSHSICCFTSQSYEKKRTEAQILAENNLLNGSPSGQMKKGSNRRMRNCIEALVQIAECLNKTLVFATLTLPSRQIHDDQYINRHLLEPFLQWLREEKGCLLTIWRAETQANGNIHYHILADQVLDNRELPGRIAGAITQKWNSILDRHGYIKPYTAAQMLRRSKGLLNPKQLAYGAANDWKQPNSVDVKRITGADEASVYMVKYISKKEKDEAAPRRPLTSRVWGCSDKLKKIDPIKISRPDIENEILFYLNRSDLVKTSYLLKDGLFTANLPEEEPLLTYFSFNNSDKEAILPKDIFDIEQAYYYNWASMLYDGIDTVEDIDYLKSLLYDSSESNRNSEHSNCRT